VITNHGGSSLFTIQPDSYIFLDQKCIRLESDRFRIGLLDYLIKF
jgi:hypothetical protein